MLWTFGAVVSSHFWPAPVEIGHRLGSWGPSARCHVSTGPQAHDPQIRPLEGADGAFGQFPLFGLWERKNGEMANTPPEVVNLETSDPVALAWIPYCKRARNIQAQNPGEWR